MKDFRNIALFVLLVGMVPFLTDSGVMLNFVMTALYACLLSQAWNVLGGFGGQFSFGHALFFGTGAYVQAIAQMQWGLSPWVALPLAMAFAAGVGAFVGAASFRYGLKGSYFALVTLAFAEVFRIVATSVSFTGAGVGLMLPLQESAANMQFANRAGFIWLMLGLVALALCITAWLKNSRFGAYLQAVVALGVMGGAAMAASTCRIFNARRALPWGLVLAALLPCMAITKVLWLAVVMLLLAGWAGGMLLVPLNALLAHRGAKIMKSGRSIAVQGFNENLSVLIMLGLYSALLAWEWTLLPIMLLFSLPLLVAIKPWQARTWKT